MQVLEPHVLAGLDLKALKAKNLELCEDKLELETMLKFMRSKVGEAFLAKLNGEFATLRSKYAEVKGDTDRDIVIALISLQSRERCLTEQIDYMDNLRKNMEILDGNLKLCEDAIKSKETAGRSRR